MIEVLVKPFANLVHKAISMSNKSNYERQKGFYIEVKDSVDNEYVFQYTTAANITTKLFFHLEPEKCHDFAIIVKNGDLKIFDNGKVWNSIKTNEEQPLNSANG